MTPASDARRRAPPTLHFPSPPPLALLSIRPWAAPPPFVSSSLPPPPPLFPLPLSHPRFDFGGAAPVIEGQVPVSGQPGGLAGSLELFFIDTTPFMAEYQATTSASTYSPYLNALLIAASFGSSSVSLSK